MKKAVLLTALLCIATFVAADTATTNVNPTGEPQEYQPYSWDLGVNRAILSDNGDTDGTNDCLDNCQTIANPGQDDADLDRIGDLCDNCSNDANAGQEDGDADRCQCKQDYLDNIYYRLSISRLRGIADRIAYWSNKFLYRLRRRDKSFHRGCAWRNREYPRRSFRRFYSRMDRKFCHRLRFK